VHGRMLSYFFAAGSLHPSLFPSRPTDRSGVHASRSLFQWELAGSHDNVGLHDGMSYPPIPRKSVGGILRASARFLSPRELVRQRVARVLKWDATLSFWIQTRVVCRAQDEDALKVDVETE
jgi:hypothetical protein